MVVGFCVNRAYPDSYLVSMKLTNEIKKIRVFAANKGSKYPGESGTLIVSHSGHIRQTYCARSSMCTDHRTDFGKYLFHRIQAFAGH